MTAQRLQEIKQYYKMVTRKRASLRYTMLRDCLREVEQLQGVLRKITTQQNLLKSLSEYGPCKCTASALCMKHAAADILKMINEALGQ